jgi:hypothetical protein
MHVAVPCTACGTYRNVRWVKPSARLKYPGDDVEYEFVLGTVDSDPSGKPYCEKYIEELVDALKATKIVKRSEL